MERQKYLDKFKKRRQQVVKLRDSGWTWAKIAKKMGRSHTAVMNAYKREKAE